MLCVSLTEMVEMEMRTIWGTLTTRSAIRVPAGRLGDLAADFGAELGSRCLVASGRSLWDGEVVRMYGSVEAANLAVRMTGGRLLVHWLPKVIA